MTRADILLLCVLTAVLGASCGSCASGDPCIEYRPQFSWHCGSLESSDGVAEPPFEGDLPDIATYGISAAVDGTWWIADHAQSMDDLGGEIVFGGDPEMVSLALTRDGVDIDFSASWVVEPSFGGPDALLSIAVPDGAAPGDEFTLIATRCEGAGSDCESRIVIAVVEQDDKFTGPFAIDGLGTSVFVGGCVAECFEAGRSQMRGIQIAIQYTGGPAFLSLSTNGVVVRDRLFGFAAPGADSALLAVPVTALSDADIPETAWQLEVRHPQTLVVIDSREVVADAAEAIPLLREDENIANGGAECGQLLDGAYCR